MATDGRSRVTVVVTSFPEHQYATVVVPAWDPNVPVYVAPSAVPKHLRPTGRQDVPKLLIAQVNLDAAGTDELAIADFEPGIVANPAPPDVGAAQADGPVSRPGGRAAAV